MHKVLVIRDMLNVSCINAEKNTNTSTKAIESQYFLRPIKNKTPILMDPSPDLSSRRYFLKSPPPKISPGTLRLCLCVYTNRPGSWSVPESGLSSTDL